MAAKIGAARRETYFKALAETGNQAIAAERARVSLYWAKRLRKCDAGFAARFDATLADARARLRAGEGAMPRGWGSLDGVELVVQAGNGRAVQIKRAALRQWTPRIEARFLSVLAATCNVTASAKAVGLSPASAYYHADRWPAFAERWRAAIEEGAFRIELQLMARATRSLSPIEGEAAPGSELDEDAAFHQLYMHQHALRGRGKAPGRKARWRPEASDEALRVLIRNIERIEARKRSGVVVDAATRAADRAAWDRRGAR
jgi:hypothetical protein